MANDALSRAVRFGLIAGCVATIVMDIVMIGTFSMMGMAAGTFFSFIGTAANTFSSMIGINMGGGIPVGAALHYLIVLAPRTLLQAGVLHPPFISPLVKNTNGKQWNI